MGGWGVSRVRRVGCGADCRSVAGLVCCRFVCFRHLVRLGGSLPPSSRALSPAVLTFRTSLLHLFHGLRSPRRAILPLAYRCRPALPARLSPSSNSRFRFRRACPPSRWS